MNDATTIQPEATQFAYAVMGVTDERTECEFCGKTELKRTVAFQEVETGRIVYAGTTCAQHVKLRVVGADGEALPRSAGQILTLARRVELERECEALVDSIRWCSALAVAEICEWSTELRYDIGVDERSRIRFAGWVGSSLANAARWYSLAHGEICGGCTERLARSQSRSGKHRLVKLQEMLGRMLRSWDLLVSKYAPGGSELVRH